MTTNIRSSRKLKTFVLDTNILLHEPSAITNFANHNVVIPITVLEELDNFKRSQDDVGHASREVTRVLDTIFPTKDALEKGYTKPQGGTVRISMEMEPVNEILIEDKADHRILGCALAIQRVAKIKGSVILVTKDVNLRVKARALGMRASDLKKDREITQAVVEKRSGSLVVKVSDDAIETLYREGGVQIEHTPENYTFVLLEDTTGRTAPAKHLENGFCRKLLTPSTNIREGRSIKPRNLEQQFLADALADPKVSVVTVFGAAGTGKTLLAIASGLSQIQDNKFDKLLISRAIIPMGKDIGFLPGTEEQKMRPWVQPCYDALEYIFSKEKGQQFKEKPQRKDQKHAGVQPQGKTSEGPLKPHERLKAKGQLEIEVLAHIRGRSIPNAFFVVDELQNATKHEVKTIVTRMSEGSKIILIGDPDQIDNPYLDRYSNGLVYAATKLAGEECHSHVQLVQGERSKLAELAAKKL